ncbi:MAG: GNAT family N-acetyltransferase, partial [Frankia sp.]|nr:GNAT family N-acetyltransferase [Frankia sp.]
MAVIFETGRLRARDWSLDDAEPAFGIYGDPEVMRYLGSAPNPARDVADQRERLARRIAQESPAGLGVWALDRRADDVLVGAVILNPFPDIEPTEVEVGWHLGRAYWGNGYATEAGAA